MIDLACVHVGNHDTPLTLTVPSVTSASTVTLCGRCTDDALRDSPVMVVDLTDPRWDDGAQGATWWATVTEDAVATVNSADPGDPFTPPLPGLTR